MCKRLFSFLNHVAEDNPNGDVLVIGHERVITNILVRVLGLHIQPNDIPVDHTGIIKLLYAQNTWTVVETQGITLPNIK